MLLRPEQVRNEGETLAIRDNSIHFIVMDQTIDEVDGIGRPWHDSHPQPMRFHHHFLVVNSLKPGKVGSVDVDAEGLALGCFNSKERGMTARWEPNRDDLSGDGARSLSKLFPKRGPGEVVRINQPTMEILFC
jgi:hypothetical protein